jgi:hypothetical protein
LNIRLGLLGTEDSLQCIKQIAAEYNEFDCLPCLWSKIDDIIPLLQANADKVDMWLFAGRIPYLIVQEWGGIIQPIFHLPYQGASLYKTLCEIFYTQKVKMDEISFDSILYGDLKQVFRELGIDGEPVHVKPFKLGMTEEESVQYHYELWKNHQTKLAVTCAFNIKKGLQQLGVPFYRVLPARTAVESTLNMMLRTYEMQNVRDAQIAMQMFEFDSLAGVSKEWLSTDDLYMMEMKATQKLIAYAKRVQGSLKLAGPGRFVVFTTRGMLRTITENFTKLPDLEEFEQISCGIGMGRSAYEAEFHAAKALLTAKEYGAGTWMIYFDDKTVTGPLGKKEQINYSYVSDELIAVSKETSLSVSTLNKLMAIMRKNHRTEISAYEVAQYMQILPRSAHRIITELEKKGYAQIVGEENPNPRGRPRKLYRIQLEQK